MDGLLLSVLIAGQLVLVGSRRRQAFSVRRLQVMVSYPGSSIQLGKSGESDPEPEVAPDVPITLLLSGVWRWPKMRLA